MPSDDSFIPSAPPLHQRAPSPEARGRCGSHPPCLSQLDLHERAAAAASGVSPEPELPPSPSLNTDNLGGAGSPRHSSASVLKELKDVLPEEPKQYHTSQVSVTRTAPSYRYPRSKSNWASKERSTPEGYNKEHAWRFEFSFPPQITTNSILPTSQVFNRAPVSHPPKKEKKTPEERAVLREKRIAQIIEKRKRVSRNHAKMALRKYNRANNTKFELVEMSARVLFFEFGAGCYHYNFKAKTGDHDSSDGSMKLFFAEIDYPPRSEDHIRLCCIVGENDSGHCYGCEGEQPMVIHPSSNAYGGGSSTCTDMPLPDGESSDSD